MSMFFSMLATWSRRAIYFEPADALDPSAMTWDDSSQLGWEDASSLTWR